MYVPSILYNISLICMCVCLCVFAYIDEPVWAIGTGLVCPASAAQDIHAYIRSLITLKYGKNVGENIIIQYGGSVKPDNVKEIMSMPDIDGCLVGGASLTADSFAKIIKYEKVRIGKRQKIRNFINKLFGN